MPTDEKYLDELLKSVTTDEKKEDIDKDDEKIEDILPIKEDDLIPDEFFSDEDIAFEDEESIDNSESITEKERQAESENEESVISSMESQEDVKQVIDLMDEDESLSEIKDLLEKSDNNETIDEKSLEDQMLELLSSVEEIESPNQEKAHINDKILPSNSMEGENSSLNSVSSREEIKKSKKKKRKADKEINESDNLGEDITSIDAMDVLIGEDGDEKVSMPSKKKLKWIQKIIEALFNAEEDNLEENQKGSKTPITNDAEIFSDLESIIPSKENREIIEELDKEDSGKNKKKEKQEKKEKEKKEKQEKQEKKDEKKKKNEKTEKVEKKLNKKKVRKVFMLAFTLLILILLIVSIVPSLLDNKKAKEAYHDGDYMTAYELLYGKELNESEKVVFSRAAILLQLERKIDMYRYNRTLLNDKAAIDSLLQGIARYSEFYEKAVEYSITDKFDGIYDTILSLLLTEYGIDEETALKIVAYEDDYDYTKHIESILAGVSYPPEVIEEVIPVDPLEDMLPEEYEKQAEN